MKTKVTIEVENAYSDGHESKHEVVVDAPSSLEPEAVTAWFEDVVWQHTGDGHGEDSSLGSCYRATVKSAGRGCEALVGEWYEWV
jgi:hypothetical protein